MSPRAPTPIVAIVGRPNVGKSRLFNRYAGRARALVKDTPGVTRDRIAEEIEVEGRHILLVDTARLDPEADDDFSSAVQAQAQAALEQADAIVLVVDGKTGLLPDDEAIARTLRRTHKPLVVAVNKIDIPAHEPRTAEFHRLGLQPLRAVSAEHGSGAFDALEELVRQLPAPEDASDVKGPEGSDGAGAEEIRIAVVGRPNVGKSSLVNRMLGHERVTVSSVPGTTRDSIEVAFESEGERFVLVDTAGLRRQGRRSDPVERGSALMTVRAVERAEVALILIDAAEGFTDQDAHVASLVRERGCASVVLANKWDRVDAERREAVLEAVRHGLRFMSDAPVLAISAETGARLTRILPLVRRVAQAATARIPTADLNRWLEDTVERHAPSMARRSGHARRPIKFFYATQASVRPPTFVLFCTEPRAIQATYRRFLENRLREDFGFEGTPLRLRLRARKG